MKLENNLKKKSSFDFTIITVVKNDERNIERTIKSVLSQINVKVQYIVLDGYSSDRTFEKIDKYKNSIKIIRYKDKSFYDGLNYAIKHSQGNYIGILNSGDLYFDKDVLSKINFIKDRNDFIFGDILFYNEKNEIIRFWDMKFSYNKNLFFFYIPHSSLFVSYKIMKNYLKSYNLQYKISSDTDLIIRLNLKRNIKYQKINSYLVFMKTGGLSTNLNFLFKKIKEDIIILQSHFIYSFPILYIKKIFIKLRGFFKFKNKEKFKKQLILTIKNLDEL